MTDSTYNCLIVDDEPIAIRVIKNHLSEFKNLNLVGECSNAIEAIELLSRCKVDLIFLDIQMPQITGVEFLKSLNQAPKVIFTTAYRDYAIDAFELDVVDYLLKPISLVRFSKAVNRFYQRMNESTPSQPAPATEINTDYIFLKVDKKYQKVLLTDVLYIESFGDYLIVHCEGNRFTIKDRISQMEEQLPSEQFLRVHRGFIVSLGKITALLPGLIEIGSHRVPIGRSYRDAVENFRQGPLHST
ncbi:LytR/AlgR family response regulator transcription factor [Mangrovibacterium diazotrophicum]|uniref:LytTR family two component transcriptional regulator n=1 Tax=Mangrovibacterium diazotrophicum TaxID=1261403 RepID=A0A419W7X8_9BACT|nr:LytTR family DNA-binding domain-containing protein [Mangrovibacterium diazotrophicum]RKD91530.1 LytTR family two component transcriptional regulator [Mangrovibacterium diazotrophicum]